MNREAFGTGGDGMKFCAEG